MNKFIGLTKRNMLVYFKDKSAVLFSMLTPIIVFSLYMIFIKQTYTGAIENSAGALLDIMGAESADMLSNGLLLAGILGSALITVPFNCLTTIVSDRENKIDFDISSTPIKRWQIILSYFCASALSSIIMNLIILSAGIAALCVNGDLYISIGSIAAMAGFTCLGAISSSAIFLIVMMFFKSTTASGAFMGILSAVSGFLIGAYVPLSEYSAGLRGFCNILPATGITNLYRDSLMNGLLNHIDDTVNGVDGGMFRKSIEEIFTFKTEIGGKLVTTEFTCYYIVVITMLALIAVGIIYPRICRRK